jgi:hypothetical protein
MQLGRMMKLPWRGKEEASIWESIKRNCPSVTSSDAEAEVHNKDDGMGSGHVKCIILSTRHLLQCMYTL